MQLEKANKIMGIVNKHYDAIKEATEKYEMKRLHNENARLVYEGLRFALIEMSEMVSELDEFIVEDATND